MELLKKQERLAQVVEQTILKVEKTGEQRKLRTKLVLERPLEIYINGNCAVRLACTPCCLAELTLGWLYSEGRIRSAEDVDKMEFCEEDTKVFCAGLIGTAGERTKAERRLSDSCWNISKIFYFLENLEKEGPLRRETKSVHASGLMTEDEKFLYCEDAGRHNALDKTIGSALYRGYALENSILYTTGRISAEMALKAIRSKIPVFVGKRAPSDRAVGLARKYGLTLLGEADMNSFKVFSGYLEESFYF